MSHGQHTAVEQPLSLRAGAATMRYENGEIRYLHVGSQEILRRVYVAVRDHNWGTVPARITVYEMIVQPDSFTLRFHAEHQQDNIHFAWEGAIIGSADSSLTFTMSGSALSTFLRNRIGFCILHPMTCAGAPCVVEQVDGTKITSTFPVEIVPHQPFLNMRAISHEVAPGLQAEVRFDGDTFEMEDQRNWTDASYKTYCTPLELPFPLEVTAGTHIHQAVTLRLHGIGDTKTVEDETSSLQIRIAPQAVVGQLPRLGICAAGHGQPLTPFEINRLRLLHLAHLRTDVRFDQANWRQQLRQNIDEATQLGSALEVVLHLGDQPSAELTALRRILDQQKPAVIAWLLFSASHPTTPPEMVVIARRYLEDYAPSTSFVGGTDAFFVQLNRHRPATDGLDLLTYSLTPQVHAFDNASLVETLPTQAVTLASGRDFSNGRGLIVSPVTLKMRFNPASTRPDAPPSPDSLPPQVDPRQMSLFGAGWTLGSIKYLGEGGAYSATYYETTGWLGAMEQEKPPTASAQFPAQAGEVFPLFHVLADAGEWADAEIVRSTSSQPLSVDVLALRNGSAFRLLLANFKDTMQTVEISGIRGAGVLHMLDEHNVAQAASDPDTFRSRPGEHLTLTQDRFPLELAPFAVARIDLSAHE